MMKFRFDCIHTVSEATKRDIQKIGNNKPIHVIPNCLQEEKSLNLELKKEQFVYLGRLMEVDPLGRMSLDVRRSLLYMVVGVRVSGPIILLSQPDRVHSISHTGPWSQMVIFRLWIFL